MEKNKKSLKTIIYRNYLTSSLIPIFAIEIVLLVLYFTINNFITYKSKDILLTEVRQDISHILLRESDKINSELKYISDYARILQSENQRFFQYPDSFSLPCEPPRFKTSEKGVFYKVNDNGGSSLFYGRRTMVKDKEYQKALKTEAFDPLYKLVKENNSNIVAVYFNTFDEMNRYYPFIPEVYKQYDPDLHMEDFNFYYEADIKHNPDKKPVWTDVYLDPAGKGWMLSCVVPVYNKDFLEGVTGIDVTIDIIVRNIIKLDLPWEASLFLVNDEGMILAMPEKVENLMDLKELKDYVYKNPVSKEVLKPEEYNILKNKDELIVKQIKTLFGSDVHYIDFFIKGKTYLLFQERVKETGWRLLLLIDRDIIFKPVYELEYLARDIGYGAIVLMLLFYFLFFIYLLRKSTNLSEKISEPVIYLTEATSNLGKDLKKLDLAMVGIEEIDTLSSNFNQMSLELDLRTKELIDSQIREKIKETEAELAYNAGLFESASSYLHNIGNALSGLDGKLLKLKHILDSMKQYPQIFRKIKEHPLPESSLKDIDKFEDILLNRVIPALNQYTEEISQIQSHMILTIKHQQEAFVETRKKREKFIQKFSIKELIENILYDFQSDLEKRNIKMETEFSSPDLFITNQRHQIIHGIINLFRNSMEAIEESENKDKGNIFIKAEKICTNDKDNRVLIIFRDNGSGIKEDNMPDIFKAGFTTKKYGHGLGLHSFLNFLSENKGTISVSSEGINRGTEFRIEVGSV
jgi:signal transduction histidine kinase